MADERPIWADDLKRAFEVLKGKEPRPLLEIVELLSQESVSDNDLASFISAAKENDIALTRARSALAWWDATDTIDFGGTAPHTVSRRKVIYPALKLGPNSVAAFDQRVDIFEKPAVVISREFEPWYADERPRRANMYWNDYERYLREVKQWPEEAIAALDETTTDVVSRLSRPTREEIKQTKGLVVGYVQSGKTANFTGVAAKAIDAGYRLVIVLTGTIEILRSQTQRRLDMELMGEENILSGQDPTDPAVLKELDYQFDRDWLDGKFVKHGDGLLQPGVAEIARVTSHQSDYKRLPQAMTKMKFARKNKRKPLNDEDNLFDSGAYVAVVKKNSAPLKKLIQDLKPLKGDLSQLPVLIIDDESDQASVDTTNPDKWKKDTMVARKRTAINELITQILAICPRAQYVGYTATPFANVFVDPDDDRDLFPSDFVLSLKPPPGYMGVRHFHDIARNYDDEPRTFANSNEKAYVRNLLGDPKASPDLRYEELQNALDSWVLSGAIKLYRQGCSSLRFRHHTMLIHEATTQAAHAAAAEDVRRIWSQSLFGSSLGLSRLRRLYEEDLLPVMVARANGDPVPSNFDELKPFIQQALAKMTIDGDPVLIVNSDKQVQEQQKRLDFEADSVWKILVGGAQLSRGFTIEGLTVSFFRRKTGQADTLMQAGRWFGFRPGYKDLVRLYIKRDNNPRMDLYKSFEALLLDEEAFRDELTKYAGFDASGRPTLEPRHIPPLVSQHLPWLKPTARNKMWNAVITNKAPIDVQDLYGLPERGSSELKENFANVTMPLLKRLDSAPIKLGYKIQGEGSGDVNFLAGLIPASAFGDLLSQMHWNDNARSNLDTVTMFIKTATQRKEIADWLVMLPVPKNNDRKLAAAGLPTSIPVVTRSRRAGRSDFVGSDRKHREAARRVTRGEAIPRFGASDARGIVLLSVTSDSDPSGNADVGADDAIGLISIAVPRKAIRVDKQITWSVMNRNRPDDVTVNLAAVT
ncbi:Z1 domain-containing protein [Dietzia sp. 111N12-1]|uniref:Z1 domain-containing protein n=1 Tax=Dietzia sp. 111N12-1 TaxID=1785156 RepID=UPI00080546A3|nr:Z1 domain-containing protein [Dietzia sp. 111N12-1]OAV77189.1 hypothetical protein AYO52_16470 [Dietzia sp. 111N12-1]